MSVVTLEHLKAICPRTPAGKLAEFVEPVNSSIEEFGVQRVADYVAQWAHETLGFTKLEEDLRYSAARLAQVWKRYAENPQDPVAMRRPNELAHRLAGNPEALANNIYADRMGNGNEASGDGWAFRGRGGPHLTGRDNYTRAAAALGVDIVTNPDLLLDPSVAMRAAGWFWQANGCDGLADFLQQSERINGRPANGMESRYAYLGRAKAALA